MRPEVVVHHLGQAKAALAAAAEGGVDIQLSSAPDAAASAGVGYLRALSDVVDHELLIDCGDDAGIVMAALRAGCRRLVFSGEDDARERLAQMSKRMGAMLYQPEDRSPNRHILAPDDDANGVRDWLRSLC